MKKKAALKTILILLAIALFIGFVAVIAYNYKTKTSFKFLNNNSSVEVENNAQDAVSAAVNKEAQEGLAKIDPNALKVSNSEMALGNKNAPVVMIEYASLSCPHCAAFYREAFEKLKTEYIETGKLQFVYRDFPLNQPALAASMIAICRSQDEKENGVQTYYSFIKALFKTQDSWAFDQKYIDKLEAIAMLDGMSVDRFKSCIEDKKIQAKILESRIAASKSLQLHSTPTFYINGEVLEGYVDYLTIKKVIDKKLQQN